MAIITNKEIVKSSDAVIYANKLAKSIRSRLRWSSKLRGTVRIGIPRKYKDTVSVKVSVGEGHEGMARAFEYGSGIHATRGKKGLYKIEPRNKKFLSFAGTNDFAGRSIITFLVMHPGVRPRPFIRPSIDAVHKGATTDLAISVKKNVKSMLTATLKSGLRK